MNLPTMRPYSTNPEALEHRLRRAGLRKRVPVQITYRGVEGTITEMAILWGQLPNTVRKRLKRGWSAERALTQWGRFDEPGDAMRARLQAIRWRIESLERQVGL